MGARLAASTNGPEFIARAVKEWLADEHVKTLYIEPGRRVAEYLCQIFQLTLS